MKYLFNLGCDNVEMINTIRLQYNHMLLEYCTNSALMVFEGENVLIKYAYGLYIDEML